MKKLEDLPIGAIDDKKIEEAAQGAADLYEQDLPIMSYNEDTEVDGQHHFCQEFGAELFKEGAKWAINEFLKDLWHPASEKPLLRIGKCLVVDNSGKIDIFKISYVYEMLSNYGKDSMKWKYWAYISDLIQEEGGKQ